MIVKYKELELLDHVVSPEMALVLDRIRSLLQSQHLSSSTHVNSNWLPPHVIDLHADGALNAHVDSVRFSGLTVSGLSLLSSCIMRLRPSSDAQDEWKTAGIDKDEQDRYVDLLLPPRSLYCLSGPSRFRYSHELMPSQSVFRNNGQAIVRDHRLSVIFRDTKE